MVLVALLLTACESIDPADNPFDGARVHVAASPAVATTTAHVEGDLTFPDVPVLEISSEQMAANAAPIGVVDAGIPVPEAPLAAGLPAVGLPAVSLWPVRLLSTIPSAQPPRAILGLASGEERVVSPGSILAEEGLVVMMVTAGRVQLAKVEPAGDHANITTLEISAQYP